MTGSRRRRGKKKRRVDDRKELSAAERYWHRRYSLFSLFDLGIQMDEESFYSVTPEVLAAHHADRCKEFPVILDACCGVGGNTIQFALRSARVIGVDCDAAKIEMAKANAEIYGVANRIEWVKDFLFFVFFFFFFFLFFFPGVW
jgi:trimethylguanosine synthase